MNDNAPARYVAINVDMSMTPCRMASSSIIELYPPPPPPDPDREDELELHPAVETVAELGQYDEYSDPLFFCDGYELYCMTEDCSSSHDPCCDGGKELLPSNIGCCGPMATVVAWDSLRLGSENL